MQKEETIFPLFIDTDTSYSEIKKDRSPFMRGLTWSPNSNPNDSIGTNNPLKYGQNELILTQVRSNVEIKTILPDGYNLNIGSYYSVTTQETYYLNFNDKLNHGIYVLEGNTGAWKTVVIDSQLLFTDNQENFIANHRVSLKLVKDGNGDIIEKYLLITEGNSWQKYISVNAAIKTNGFNVNQFPYWKLQPPHFDRRELLEWPVRPPMVRPSLTPVPNTPDDLGKINRFIDAGFQVSFSFQYTDGRTTKLSPFSLPLLIKSQDYLNNPDDIPKNAVIKMYAGSPLVEKINIYVRKAKLNSNTLDSITEWTDWYLYDTIYKFPNPNSDNILATEYWLRINQWSSYNYDAVFNTIQYTFDLSKVQQIVADQESVNEIQSNMPQLSMAMTDLSDAELLCNNRYGYPNFGTDVTGKISVEVIEKEKTSCPIPLRNMTLYAYVGSPFDTDQWASQVGYYKDDTKEIVFGGLSIGGANVTGYDDKPTNTFQLNFADKKALRCYLKGTPYFSDGVWYQVNSDNSLVKIQDDLDIREISVQEYIQSVYVGQGYFVCVFNFTVPAGRYIAALGRHNVESSGDYRDTSTYVYGIANSRMKSQTVVPGAASLITAIKPNAINNTNGILFSKEMEVDCTSADVDVWGNGADLFYVYCPYITKNHNYRFIEGYFKEKTPPTNGTSLPVELFPYQLNHAGSNDWGMITDKNGFYWAYSNNLNSPVQDIQIVAKVNCIYPQYYIISTSQSGGGWKQNTDSYLASFNGGSVGNANRIIYSGKITSLDGTLTYSNIAVSVKDGSTAYTRSDGTFTIIVHNGMNVLRISNVYVNAGSNFIITISGCGQIPLFNFDESLAPCVGNAIRTYPIPLNLAIQISTDSQTSLMDDGKYNVGAYCADLAGRVMYVNVITEIAVPSFLQRNNLNATFLRMLFNKIDFSNYPDMKWFMPCVSKNVNIKRQVQWVGDGIDYIDNSGNIVTDSSSAVFCSIKVNSLLNYNIANNFSLLASYQFVQGDRLRVLDDGDGNLFNVATYGDPIDLQILGTSYLQAAINAGLLPPQVNTVVTTPTTTSADVTLIVKYDSRLDKLINKTGFWIEMYTPTEQSDVVPFFEDYGFYPIVNNAIATFTGYSNGNPDYTYPLSIDLDFWDTYLFDRNITIPNVGNKFFSHPFESQNVTDNWCANITSGGRINIKNENAQQYWLANEAFKSDGFFNDGLINGLATFRNGNRKNFNLTNYGGFIAVYAESNLIFFGCENNWFITDYDYHYAFINTQGIVQANLDGGISTPHQKIGSQFGIDAADTGTFIQNDKELYWYDRKNTAWVKCTYTEAVNVAEKSSSEQGGMYSFFASKSDFITNWNSTHKKENSFDVIAGIDEELMKIYVTFRCRRNNSNAISSYINNRRNWQLNYQETVVYDINNKGWLRAEGFCPEGYGVAKGNVTGMQMITFAAGKPYLHNVNTNGFNNFYGVQTQAVMICAFNQDNDVVKLFESHSYAGNPNGWYVDKIFTDFKNSFSYISSNQYKVFYNKYYAALFRNMNSYPNSTDPSQLFRSELFDGYRLVGRYMILRMASNYDSLDSYKELGAISMLEIEDDSNKDKATK